MRTTTAADATTTRCGAGTLRIRTRTGARFGAMLAVALALAIAGALALSGTAAAETGVQCAKTGMESVLTDKDDYRPGETVHITGAGYHAWCDVEVLIERPDGVVERLPSTTDLAGNLSVDYELPGVPGVIGEYGVTVQGLDGVALASTTFLDGSTAVDIAPAKYPSGSEQTRTFSVLVRNIDSSASGWPARCVQVQLPSGYTVSSSSLVGWTVAGGTGTWTASAVDTSNRRFELRTTGGGLPSGNVSNNWARFDLSVTAPASSTAAWLATLRESSTCSSGNNNGRNAGVLIGSSNWTYTASAEITGQSGSDRTFKVRLTNTSGGNGDNLSYGVIALDRCLGAPSGVGVTTVGKQAFSATTRDGFILLTGGILEKDKNPDEYVDVTFTASVANCSGSISFPTAGWKSSEHSTGAADTFTIQGSHASVTLAANNASISGTVYNDVNGNGAFDAGDAGILGVTVSRSGTSSGTATTDANGAYSFTGLAAGTYSVDYTVPTGFANTGTKPIGGIALTSSQSSTGNNFFARRTTSTALSGAASSTYGSPATFTATVTSASGTNPNSQGTVTFRNGATVLCLNVALTGNTATCTPSLSADSYSIMAEYSGSTSAPGFSGSTSDALTHSVGRRPVTASITAADKVFDGTTTAEITSCSLDPANDGVGKLANDDVGCAATNGQFDTAAVGEDKQVTANVALTGAAAGNYQLTSNTAATSADITKRPVTASITAADKVYDGTADADITSCTLDTAGDGTGVIEGDDVGCTAANGQFDSAAAGEDKQVTANVALTGAAAGNYQLTSDTATTTADITKRPVTAAITATNKVYNGTTAATIDGCSLDTAGDGTGVIDGDDVDCSATGQFEDAAAGEDKQVTANVALTGAAAGNYQLTSDTATTTADITKRPVTAAIVAAHKVYDGTTAAEITSCSLNAASNGVGVVASDAGDPPLVACEATNGQFATPGAGNNKPVTATVALTGTAADNYQLTSTTASTTANITRAPLTITADSVSKELGAPNPPFTVSYDGFVNDEGPSVLGGTLVLTFQGVAPTSYGPSTTPPQGRGNYAITPSGLTSANYLITFEAGVYAINGAYFVFLDEDVIRKGSPPFGFTAPSFTDADVNESKARIGQRDPLAWFGASANYGRVIDLPSGQVGDEGWFALTSLPPRWASAGPTNNGLRNLLRAGPGLGGGTNKEALLDKVRDVTPLRATALKLLETNLVCAIVWKSDISINYGPLNGSLKGDNRGIVGFEVVSVSQYGSGSTLPRVTVRVLEPRESVNGGVCKEPLALLGSAPAPTSSSSPMDVAP